ncbi:MAG: LysM peptidoglycan-binding domain-containing protein [Bacteroidota bacterium]
MNLFFRQLLVLLLIIVICPVSQAENDVILTQDLEYINSGLEDVIRDLAEIGGFRVILDRQVQGEVTLTLMHGITAKEAIGTVARGYGYSSRWLNASALMIGTSAFINGNFAARSTRIHTLKNADPVLVAEKLQTVIPRERIKINHETKELTVTADIAEHQNISDLISRLDYSNSPIDLEIRVVEINDALWKMLRLETDWRPTELGAVILTAEQQKLIQGNAAHLLLGKSDLTCFNYQEAKLLLGDYLIKPAQLNNGQANRKPIEELESGTQLILTPSLLSGGGRLQLKISASVKMVADHQQSILRGIHSIIGLNLGETILFNGVLQRNEYLNLKQSTGYQHPILENLFARRLDSVPGPPARIILLVTPKPADGNEQAEDERLGSQVDNQSDAVENTSPPPVLNETDPGNANQEETIIPLEEKPVIIFDAVVVPEKQPTKDRNISTGNVRKKGDLYEIDYLVKKGDTPIGIARKYGVELSAILVKNHLTNTDVIKVGSVLIIPVPAERVYVVKPKETLWRIAKRYGVAIEMLMDLNGIDDQTKVNQGQALILPTSNQNVVNPQF